VLRHRLNLTKVDVVLTADSLGSVQLCASNVGAGGRSVHFKACAPAWLCTHPQHAAAVDETDITVEDVMRWMSDAVKPVSSVPL
jgi:hypothetical protein